MRCGAARHNIQSKMRFTNVYPMKIEESIPIKCGIQCENAGEARKRDFIDISPFLYHTNVFVWQVPCLPINAQM